MPGIKNSCVNFYDNKWGEWNSMIRYSPAPRIRREKVVSWVKKWPCNSLIDIGCGNGIFLQQLKESMPNLKLFGADISQEVIRSNNLGISGIEFFQFDLDADSYPGTFDVVVCMEVIEHCHNFSKAIENLVAMARKYLIITLPVGPLFEIDRRCGHIRHFKPKEITNILIRHNFKISILQSWGFPFFNIYKYLINLTPDSMSESFLYVKRYGFYKKLLAFMVYGIFKLNLPCWGYQLFAVAEKR